LEAVQCASAGLKCVTVLNRGTYGDLDEVRALLDRTVRKDIKETLDVSTALLSQWSTGKELIPEHHLATLVDSLVERPEMKQQELLRLLLMLWLERVERDATVAEPKRRWLASSAGLAKRTMERALTLIEEEPLSKSSGRTLREFPHSFYPLAIICGDKREQSESRISRADFGAVSPSPAEFRWLCSLGLRQDVELYGDKVFVLETYEQLRERFGQKHLLVVGSPGSNHLARRCLLGRPKTGWLHAAPIFRFNLPQSVLQKIEEFVESLDGLRPRELVGKQAEEQTERAMKNWLRYLFAGGILDPTHTGHWVHGLDLNLARDYGLVTIARNPFSESRDTPYLCVMVAGFHLFGTAHALKMFGNPEKTFSKHPYGGVVKVHIDTTLPFAKRFDDATPEWDDPAGYALEDIIERMNKMKTGLVSWNGRR
jgi:hypothetical protein